MSEAQGDDEDTISELPDEVEDISGKKLYRFLDEEISFTFEDNNMTSRVEGCGKNKPRQIVSYDQLSLIRGNLLIRTHIFQGWYIWIQAVAIPFLGLLIAMAFRIAGMEMSDNAATSAKEWNQIALYAMGIFLTFYSFNSLGRWWIVRSEHLSALRSAYDSIAMATSIWFPDDKDLSVQILRHGLLSMELLGKQCKNELGGGVDDLVARGFLTAKEKGCLSLDKSPVFQVIQWTGQVLFERIHDAGVSNEEGWADGHWVATAKQLVTERLIQARGAVQGTITFINTQLPLSFIYLTVALFKLTCILMICTLAVLFEHTWRVGGLFSATMFGYFIMGFITPTIFQSILEVAEMIRNPLGDDPEHLPMRALIKSQRQDTIGFITSGNKFRNSCVKKDA